MTRACATICTRLRERGFTLAVTKKGFSVTGHPRDEGAALAWLGAHASAIFASLTLEARAAEAGLFGEVTGVRSGAGRQWDATAATIAPDGTWRAEVTCR